MKWLVKSSEDTICFCECDGDNAIAAPPGWSQMDCPWCGCGWLFTCATCGLAFTYAVCKDAPDLTPARLANDYYKRVFGEPCPPERLRVYAGEVVSKLTPLVVGAEYIVLDGQALNTSITAAVFTGEYANHSLAALPHVKYRGDREGLVQAMCRDYWLARKRG
jgi:hypothetical protein